MHRKSNCILYNIKFLQKTSDKHFKMSNLSAGLLKNLSIWRIATRGLHISQSLKIHKSSCLTNRRNFDAEKMEMKSAIRTRESVFSIEQVVDLLKQEAVLDLCVIKVPPERRYVEYFVICSPRNDSQLISVPAALRAMYKDVFGERKYVEGLGDGTKPPEWTVIDLGKKPVMRFLELKLFRKYRAAHNERRRPRII